MKLPLKFFQTRVASRLFMLFILCAMVPISGFALLSFNAVKRQLNEQCLKRLHQENKAMAVSIYERLSLYGAEMRLVASSLSRYPENFMQHLGKTATKELKERFAGLTLMTDKGSVDLFAPGHMKNPPNLSIAERQHLKSGKALLHQQLIPNARPRLFIGVLLDPDHPNRGVLLGEIKRTHLWDVADRTPPMAELSVIDWQKNLLFSSLSGPVSFPEQSRKKMNLEHSGQFECIYKTQTYFVDYTSVFLEPNFYFPKWIVVLSEPSDEALLTIASFKRWFPAVVILSLAMVFYLSVSLIRKTMSPIAILQQATRKIADGDFGHNVAIETGDEFESLGRSFNKMSDKLKEGQALLVQSAKLSAIGQMAAGVMHEIKQPLTAIHGLLQLSVLDDQIPNKSKELLETAEEAVERLNSILLRFSAFARPQEEIIENISITNTISHICQLLGHELMRKNIQYHIEAEEALPQIRGDRHGLEQVFSNLLINAVHALEDRRNGHRLVSIRAYSTEDEVLVEVEDNGCGIPEDIQERIYDPFFTTKGAEKGTGLGMAVVASILHKHRATLGVESKVGVGTKFTMAFPVLHGAEE